MVTWSARAGVDMYGCSGSLDPGDVSAGRWWGYFTDLLVVLEGTRWRARLGRAERRATVRGARRRGTRKGRPIFRESQSVRRPKGRTTTERSLAIGVLDRLMPPTSIDPHS